MIPTQSKQESESRRHATMPPFSSKQASRNTPSGFPDARTMSRMLSLVLAGNVGVVSAIFSPQNDRHADMSAPCCRHDIDHVGDIAPCRLVEHHVGVVSATWSNVMSVSCQRHSLCHVGNMSATRRRYAAQAYYLRHVNKKNFVHDACKQAFLS